MNYSLNFSYNIWQRELNSLFNYESINFDNNDLNVSSSGYLSIMNDKLTFNKMKPNVKTIGSISNNEDEYRINFDDEIAEKTMRVDLVDDKTWLVIRGTDFNGDLGYRLKKNDIFKIGKITFHVIDVTTTTFKGYKKSTTITNKDEDLNDNTVQQNEKNNDLSLIEPKEGENELDIIIKNNAKIHRRTHCCKICLCEDNEVENPLINPCKCSGSMKYIHVNCLKTWIRSKVVTKLFRYLIVHCFRNVKCELCKTSIPDKIKINNEVIFLLDLNAPDTNYVILESINKEKSDNKYIYIIHLKEPRTIKIGRANESDIRMNDNSVSRNHANLKLCNGSFYLEDNFSKFGTVSLIQSDIMVYPKKTVAIQANGAYLKIVLQKTCLGLLKCYENANLMKSDLNNFLKFKKIINYEKVYECFFNSTASIKSELIHNSNINEVNQDKIEKKEEMHNIINIKAKAVYDIENNNNSSNNDMINVQNSNPDVFIKKVKDEGINISSANNNEVFKKNKRNEDQSTFNERSKNFNNKINMIRNLSGCSFDDENSRLNLNNTGNKTKKENFKKTIFKNEMVSLHEDEREESKNSKLNIIEINTIQYNNINININNNNVADIHQEDKDIEEV